MPVQQEINLRQYWEILQRRKGLALLVLVLVFVVGVVWILREPPVYRAQAQVLVPTPSFALNVYDSSNPIASLLVDAQPDTLETQLQLMNTPDFLAEAASNAGIRPRPGVAPPAPYISTVENASIINVRVDGGDPEDVYLLANSIVKLHEERSAERNDQGLANAMQRGTEQVKQLEEEVAALQGRMNDYYRSNPLTNTGAAQDQLGADYSQVLQKQQAAETAILATQREIPRVEAQLKATRTHLVEIETEVDPNYTNFQQRLDERLMEQERLRSLYAPESTEMIAIGKEIASIRELAKDRKPNRENERRPPNPEYAQLQGRLIDLRAELFSAQRELEAAKAQLRGLEPMVQQAGPNVARLGALKAQLDEKRAQLAQATKLLNDLRMRESARPNHFRIIQNATRPTAPIAPNRPNGILMAVALAVLFSLGITLLQEFLDDRIHSPGDIERSSTLPTLAHVPLLARDQPRLVSSLPANSQISEAYRALRSSIGFAAIDAPIRRILVTSPSKGEGKSITSANLATAFALDGRRVILVDSDLRKPNVHHLFGLPVSPGLSEMLAGLSELDDVLHDTDVDNLRCITAGAIPPNPAELLGSRAFEQFVEQLELDADVIIFDSPPCIPVTDPLILASRMDGVVLVAHVGQTHKKAIRQAELLLARARARVLGIVFNRVPIRKGQYYSYYYGYGYGGYGAGGEGIGKESTAAGLRIDADLIGYGDGEEEITPRDRGVRSAGAIGADPAHENGGRGSRQSEGYPSGRGNGHSKVRRGDDADLDI